MPMSAFGETTDITVHPTILYALTGLRRGAAAGFGLP
jgi:hypothetical protein